MSTYTSFAALDSLNFDSHVAMTSTRTRGPVSIPTKIASKTSSPSSPTSTPSSFFTNGSTSTSTSESSSPSPLPSSTSSGALSLLSSATRSSVSSPSIILEDIASVHLSCQDDVERSSIPVERLSSLVQRYDEALVAASAAQAAYQAKLEVHFTFVDELYARVAADRAQREAGRLAALIARLSPSPEYSDLVLSSQLEQSAFAGLTLRSWWSRDSLRHPVIRKALLFNEQMTSRDYVQDEVVDCWMECWRFMGRDVNDEGDVELQIMVKAAQAVRKSTVDRKNRPFYKKALDLFC